MQDDSHHNSLLRALPREERQLIAARLVLVPMPQGLVVQQGGRATEHLYLPTTALVSVVSPMEGGTPVEAAAIGREGIAPIALAHGVEITPEHLVVQVPGAGYRIALDDFLRCREQMPTLTRTIGHFTVALLAQLSQISCCNRKHSMVQRCARWLLLAREMVGRDRFELTHLVWSQLLGVRRASVTEAALTLQQAGAIEYSRGTVVVRDRERLEREACACHRVVGAIYRQLLPGFAQPDPLSMLRFPTSSLLAPSQLSIRPP